MVRDWNWEQKKEKEDGGDNTTERSDRVRKEKRGLQESKKRRHGEIKLIKREGENRGKTREKKNRMRKWKKVKESEVM